MYLCTFQVFVQFWRVCARLGFSLLKFCRVFPILTCLCIFDVIVQFQCVCALLTCLWTFDIFVYFWRVCGLLACLCTFYAFVHVKVIYALWRFCALLACLCTFDVFVYIWHICACLTSHKISGRIIWLSESENLPFGSNCVFSVIVFSVQL